MDSLQQVCTEYGMSQRLKLWQSTMKMMFNEVNGVDSYLSKLQHYICVKFCAQIDIGQ